MTTMAYLRKIIDEQAEDAMLWCNPATAVGVALQRALRRLHAALEDKSPEQCALEALGVMSGMDKALEADGEKLRALTGEDHGPFEIKPKSLVGDFMPILKKLANIQSRDLGQDVIYPEPFAASRLEALNMLKDLIDEMVLTHGLGGINFDYLTDMRQVREMLCRAEQWISTKPDGKEMCSAIQSVLEVTK